MKLYALLLTLVFALLLLIPLPALGLLTEDKPAPSSSGTDATGTTAPTSDIPVNNPTVESTKPTDAAAAFRVLDSNSNQVVTIAERDFLIGTLAAEMYPTYHIEALKAQAVAAYTYYSYERTAARAEKDDPAAADFSDVPSTFPEVYNKEGLQKRWGDDFDTYYAKICEAVDAVFGKQILYEGKPIMAAYHALSFDTTEKASVVWGKELPYLQSVPCSGDKLAPAYESTVTFTAEEFSKRLNTDSRKLEGDPAGWIGSDIQRSEAGTVTAITVGGVTLTGRELRQLLDLRSACFTVDYAADSGFTFHVKGYGHGVGLSQYGADYLARQGADWQEILKYYYTGVAIS